MNKEYKDWEYNFLQKIGVFFDELLHDHRYKHHLETAKIMFLKFGGDHEELSEYFEAQQETLEFTP